jgi:hypothetical protein
LETTLPYDRVENPKKPNENNLLLYLNIPKKQGWILLCVISFFEDFFWKPPCLTTGWKTPKNQMKTIFFFI